MKRIILVAVIALLVVLGAWFVFRRLTDKRPATTNLVPEVSKFGTLTNLKDDNGRRLFSKPIQEGFYVRYRVGDGKGQIFYAIGDRVSDLKAPYSSYQEKISGAGITTQNGLNVTSGFLLDKNKRTLKAIRTIVNLSKEKATMYLSEVKNYVDTNLLPLRTRISTAIANMIDDNCWPCQPWPQCNLESAVLDPTKATVVCINCGGDASGLFHVICLADLEVELAAYKAQGCDFPTIITGIDASGGKSVFDESCPTVSPTPDNSTSGEVMPTTGKELSETALKRLLTLPAGAAIVMATEYKIILPRR